MAKRVIRLTEQELHNIVRESVKRLIKEDGAYKNNWQWATKPFTDKLRAAGNQMAKELIDIYSRHPMTSAEIRRRYAREIRDEFDNYRGSNDLTKEMITQYQRVGSKWTLVGNNGDGTYTIFFLR